MPISILFWVLMVIWLVFGLLANRGVLKGTYVGLADAVLLFILLAIIGWQVFGPVIQR